MEDKLFDRYNVLITTERFVVRNRSYSVPEISSVSFSKHVPKRALPLVVAFAGYACVLVCGLLQWRWTPVFGVIVTLVAALWMLKQRKKYVLTIGVSGKKVSAFSHVDPYVVSRIVEILRSLKREPGSTDNPVLNFAKAPVLVPRA